MLHLLRQSRLIARLVLMCFVLSLGVAVASPVVKPDGVQLVCAGTSVKLINADEGDAGAGHGMDCPLCSAGSPPVLALGQSQTFDTPLSFALSRDEAAHIAYVTAAPLTARGPPSLLA